MQMLFYEMQILFSMQLRSAFVKLQCEYSINKNMSKSCIFNCKCFILHPYLTNQFFSERWNNTYLIFLCNHHFHSIKFYHTCVQILYQDIKHITQIITTLQMSSKKYLSNPTVNEFWFLLQTKSILPNKAIDKIKIVVSWERSKIRMHFKLRKQKIQRFQQIRVQ